TATRLAVPVLLAAWIGTSDDAYALLAPVVDAEPIRQVADQRPEVALVVRAPEAVVPAVLRSLLAARTHASFAFARARPGTLDRVRAAQDGLLPELRPGLGGSFDTGDELRQEAAWLRVPSRYALAPASGLTFAQYTLARGAGVRPIGGYAYPGGHNEM